MPRLFSRIAFASSVLVIIGIAAACGSSTPTSGGGTAMLITGVTPSAPLRSPDPQQLVIQGRNFLNDLTVIARAPDGTETVYFGSAIQNRQSSGFQLTATLSLSGTYELSVGPSQSVQSTPFLLSVRNVVTTPTITNVNPVSVARSFGLQVVQFDGINFEPNLSVMITAPDGIVTMLTTGQFQAQTSTSLQFTLAFTKPGNYQFQIVNPAGEMSNVVSITAV